MILVTEKTMNF